MVKKDKSEYIIQAVSHALDLLEQFHDDVDELDDAELYTADDVDSEEKPRRKVPTWQEAIELLLTRDSARRSGGRSEGSSRPRGESRRREGSRPRREPRAADSPRREESSEEGAAGTSSSGRRRRRRR